MAAISRNAGGSWRGSAAALVLVASCSSASSPRRDGASEAPAAEVADAAAMDVADAPAVDVADAPAVDVADTAAIVDGNRGDAGVDAADGARVAAPPAWSCVADGGVEDPDAFPQGATRCAALSSCGGDPAGQWLVGLDVVSACPGTTTGACLLADPAPGDSCAGLVYQSGPPPYIGAINLPFPTAPTVRGATLNLPPSGNFTIDIDVTGQGSFHFAPACLTSGGHPSCADLATQLEGVGPPTKGFACLPSADRGCDCSWTYGGAADPAIVEEAGTWRAEGNLLHLSAAAPDGTVRVFDYTFCVNRDVLDLTTMPGGVAFGPGPPVSGAHQFAVETLRLQKAQGTVLHWNGAGWSVTTLGNDLSPRAVAGSGPADVWAVGTFAGGSGAIGHWSGASWSEEEVLPPTQDTHTSATVAVQSIWASNPGDAWAVGSTADGPAILRWDGAAWSRVALDLSAAVLDPVNAFGGLWGSGSNDVWVGAVGTDHRPTVFRFDGTAWKQVMLAAPNTFSLLAPTGFSGTGPSDVWVVEPGPSEQIVHWDGSAWGIKFLGNGTFQPTATWGSGPNDVWAVGVVGTTGQFVVGTGYVTGPAGNIIHWDGKVWSMVDSGTTANLSAVWGGGPNDVWAVGDKGTIVRWNGAVWSPVASGTTNDLLGIWGSGPDDVWAVMN
jgi:hypothetical protein